MLRAFRSEWLKLRRRGMYLGAALMVAVGGGLVTFLTVTNQAAAGPPDRVRGPAGAPLTLAQLDATDGLARVVAREATLLGVIALALFAMSFASEYTQGTLRVALVRAPRRLRWFVGKTLAMGSFVAVAVVLAVAVGVALAYTLAPGNGITTSSWSAGPLLYTLARMIITTVAWGLIGMVLGVLIRAPAPAISVGVAYGVLLENLLSAGWSAAARWLPGQLLSAVAIGGTADTGVVRAVALLVLYLGAGALLAAFSFTRRDILV